MRSGLVIGVTAVVAALGACVGEAEGQEGTAGQRSYQVGGFTAMEVAGPYDVEVRTGSAPSVQASGPESMLERLVVEVKGDRLLIHPRKQNGWFQRGSNGTVRLMVTVPQLLGAEIAGSGNVRVDAVKGPRFVGQIGGSGNLTLGQVDVADLELGIAGSGEVVARGGRARKAKYAIAGSGDIDAAGIASETAAVSIAGSGNVAAQASGTSAVEIAGSGDVEMTGGGKCTVSRAGSGEVRCS